MTDDPRYDDPATSFLPAVTGDSRYDDPRTNPIAFLPVDALDTGDLIDPDAADPTPDEITDPEHPDYVDPWTP